AQAQPLEDVRRHAADDAAVIDDQAKRVHDAFLRLSLASPRPARRNTRARFSVSLVWSDLARYSSNPASRPACTSPSSAWDDSAISGTLFQRGSLRMALARANPSRLGISMSLMMTSKLCPASRSLSASAPSAAVVTFQLAEVRSGATRLRKKGLSSTSKAWRTAYCVALLSNQSAKAWV